MLKQASVRARMEPQWYFKNILGVELWEKQIDIVNSVRDNERTTVRSSNATGKTFSEAQIALWFLSAFPPAVVIDTAPTHRQVENQFWREFRRAYKASKRPLGGKLLKTQFNIDENWFAIGFTSKTGEDGLEAFQGWHAENILVIVDEASGVHPRVFEAIQGALAGGKVVRVLYCGNPTRNTGDFAESFKDPLFHKIHINAFDVPNVKLGRTIVPGLATLSWVEAMKSRYGVTSDVYLVKVLGEFPKKNSDTLMSVDLVESALDADRERYGADEFIGVDVARFGDDRSAWVYRKGNYAKVLEILDQSSLALVAGTTKKWLKEYPKAIARLDITGGLGAGPFEMLQDQPDVSSRVEGVNVAASATDEETYVNLRAEGWYEIAGWLRDAVLEKHEDWYQLAQPKYLTNLRGKKQLEGKADMKKRGIKSPDVGDGLALTFQRATEGGFFGAI